MTLYATTTVPSGGASSIEFTNIPQTGKDLLLVVSGRVSEAATSFACSVDLNSSGGSSKILRGTGSAAESLDRASVRLLIIANSATASTFGNSSVYISNYTSSTAKSISIDTVTENNATAAFQELAAGLSTSTSAVTSLLVNGQGPTFQQHSTASLYIIS